MLSSVDEQELQALVPLLADGKTRERAFARLVELTRRVLYWHIRRMVLVHDDADDVLQNTYLKAWRFVSGFRGDSSLSTWLYRIATNETLTFLAQQRMRSVSSPMEYEDVLLSRMEADVYFDGDEMQRRFQRAVMQLPEKQRMVFNMRYYDEMKYEQMAEVTGTSEGALKASYHIAVKKIEEYIRKGE